MLLHAAMRSAIFIERDGVLNEAPIKNGHAQPPRHMEEFRIKPEAHQVLLRLKDAGYLLIVTTNQPGLADGSLCRTELDLMHRFLRGRLPIDDILVCPHADNDNCHCHKPEAGLFTEAAFKWHLDMDFSFVVSDKWQDAAAAHVAGCTSIMINSPLTGSGHHDFVTPSFTAAADKILGLHIPHATTTAAVA